jgi:hypothetical protein
MIRLNPESIRAFLRLTTLKECLGWAEFAKEAQVREALKPLLFDPESGLVRRDIDDGNLREELFRLAIANQAFRRFLETEAALDRITAGYVQEQLDAE